MHSVKCPFLAWTYRSLKSFRQRGYNKTKTVAHSARLPPKTAAKQLSRSASFPTRPPWFQKHSKSRDLSRDLGRDPFYQNFRKFRSKTQWIGSVQPEKFRKNRSTFWGGPLSRSDRSEFWLNGSRPLWPAGDPVKMFISFQLRGFEGLTLELSWVEEYCLDKYYELKSSCRLFTGLKFTINTYMLFTGWDR